MLYFQSFAVLLVLMMTSHVSHQLSEGGAGTPLKAVAVIRDPTGNNTISGTIRIEQDSSNATINITLSGLSPGLHGFHIHNSGDLSSGCASAGPHYNPFNQTHGAPNDTVRHVGDLGNVLVDSKGSLVVIITDKQVQLSGVHSVIGRAIVVHSGTDDLGRGTGSSAAESKKTGNAGSRLGCGVIGIV